MLRVHRASQWHMYRAVRAFTHERGSDEPASCVSHTGVPSFATNPRPRIIDETRHACVAGCAKGATLTREQHVYGGTQARSVRSVPPSQQATMPAGNPPVP
jgi:hypothetical protein